MLKVKVQLRLPIKKLVYDPSDLPPAKKLKDDRFDWLRKLGAVELQELQPDDDGVLF